SCRPSGNAGCAGSLRVAPAAFGGNRKAHPDPGSPGHDGTEHHPGCAVLPDDETGGILDENRDCHFSPES
ncbi:MAG: hypothetical protein IIU05_05965, partial [Bacteroidales bacterium]|nr:hypothetical protein [Bacteroidales bacterium]